MLTRAKAKCSYLPRRNVKGIIINTRITKLLEKTKLSNPRYMLKKLIQDSDNLEKFYSDKEYRNELESAARYPSSESFQLEKIYEQEEKIKVATYYLLTIHSILSNSDWESLDKAMVESAKWQEGLQR